MKQVFVLIAFFAASSYFMMNSDRTTLGNKITKNIENLRSTDAYASMVVGTESYIKIDNRKNLLADINDIKALYRVQQNKNNTNEKMSQGNIKIFDTITTELTSIVNDCPRSIPLLQSKLSVDDIDIASMQKILTSSYSACI
tara:strand:+ start:1876 stop:2301 length:426 start_codon:yes stop_codon:yes gene_type:complete